MDDLDDVRAALGYEQINLYGTSYGTRAAQVYLRRHPQRVRCMVLKAVVPMGLAVGARYHVDCQRALDLLLEDCREDPDCRSAFPDLASHLEGLMARLEVKPEEVTVPHPDDESPLSVTLTRDGFALALRMLLYDPVSRSQLPVLIEQAAAGQLEVWARLLVRVRQAYHSELDLGMALSVLAAEDAPRARAMLEEASRSDTFLRDAFLREIVEACDRWPQAELPSGFFEPVESEVPALLLSGTLDPVTPPQYGDELARHMKNATHLVISTLGHPFGDTGGCHNRIVARFIEQAGMDGIDTSCLGDQSLPPFVLPP